jgi:tRNA dimethylallyltransferase
MSPDSTYPAIAVAGPTASGKSELALHLAESFDGEIVNYDSIQLFRLFDIGTAKPSESERKRVPHHLIDILDPEEFFSAGDYQREARRVLDEIRQRGRLPVLVGGTGLYLRAVIDGLFDGPKRSDYWRSRLNETAESRGRGHLHAVLARLDPDAAARIGARDLPKVIRALEVRLETGRPLSHHLEEKPRQPSTGYAFTVVGLAPPRPELYRRIGARVREMFDRGLVIEVRGILDRGVSPDAAAFRAIGYRQALQTIGGIISNDEAIMLTERETRRYAKRQLTWFRKQHTPVWFDGFGSDPEIRDRVHRCVTSALKSKD